jgi:hypothetical protein
MSDGTTGRRPCPALAAIGELASTVSNSTLVNTLQAASSSERPNFFKGRRKWLEGSRFGPYPKGTSRYSPQTRAGPQTVLNRRLPGTFQRVLGLSARYPNQ